MKVQSVCLLLSEESLRSKATLILFQEGWTVWLSMPGFSGLCGRPAWFTDNTNVVSIVHYGS